MIIRDYGKPEEAVEMINSWVKKATNNLIDSVVSLSDISPATDLVLANAVYFKGAWLEPFNRCLPYPSTFHRLDGSSVMVQFMTKFECLYVSCMDGFKVLKLPYEQGHAQAEAGQPPLKRRRGRGAAAKTSPNAHDTQYSMFVFLPDERRGIATMVDVITAAPVYMYSVLPKAKAAKPVKLELPKFEISFNWDLESDLRRLGLSLPFSPVVADLRGICEKDDDGRPTFLSKVAQRAVVKVNEAGTEAAAATSSLLGGGMPPPEFIADHPFTFFIMEERSGVIVFAGHVLDPTK